LHQVLDILASRYIPFLQRYGDPSDGVKKLVKISDPIKEDDRSYTGFNFFSQADHKLFEVLIRGEFNIRGFQNKSIRKIYP